MLARRKKRTQVRSYGINTTKRDYQLKDKTGLAPDLAPGERKEEPQHPHQGEEKGGILRVDILYH